MKEHPIIFSTEMVRAILEGRKTQTRRIMKPQPDEEKMRWDGERWEMYLDYPLGHGIPLSPYGFHGDLLWVRETWFPTRFDFALLKSIDHIKYKADNNFDPCKDCYGRSWKPSIHMPKWAARIWLEIINVRIERVQDIDSRDCRLEGILPDYFLGYGDMNGFMRSKFEILWDSINAKRGSWESNPWVWVIEFKKQGECNE